MRNPWLATPVGLLLLFGIGACAQDAGQPASTSATPTRIVSPATSGADASEATAASLSPTSTEDQPCSADGLDAKLPEDPSLPVPVVATRRKIVQRAVVCDFDGLAALTTEGFVYSFGGSDDPAGYWRDTEGYGEAKLKTLVTLLRGPAALEHGTWVWPPNAGADPRVGIEPGGTWVWYVAGD